MRISSVLLRLAVFLAAAMACWGAARAAVEVLEARSVVAVYEALLDNGHDWAAVQGDGLQIVIEGNAPGEAERFRAISAAGSVVDSSRVIDNMTVAESAIVTTPEFGIEFLRNESGVSMIGLVPESTDREEIAGLIERYTDGQKVTDLLDSADYPAPAQWEETLSFALRALRLLPRSKVSMMPQHLDIRAISSSDEERALWERELVRLTPPDVQTDLVISAPRPVITPFTVRFVQDGTGARLDACSADTEESQAAILKAARAAGVADPTCELGLGVPSTTWPEAVRLSLEAMQALGGGRLTIADADVSLVALQGTEPELFGEVTGSLQNDLPEVFSLKAELPDPPLPEAEGPPQFIATLSPEGMAQLRGLVTDELLNLTAENYAMARFGRDAVQMSTQIQPERLPQGWSVRVLAGIEALSFLNNGSVIVQPDTFELRGRSGKKSAKADITRMLIEKIGEDASFTVDVEYDETLDPIAAMPTPQECVSKIQAFNAASKITFDPGSSRIARSALETVDNIADVLRACPDLPLQIYGYTDSQGGEEMNKRLSQQRADSVLDALRMRRVPTRGFTAEGFGEENPIADNETEEGREANRRIEFSLPAAMTQEAAPGEAAPEAGAEDASDAEGAPAPAAQDDQGDEQTAPDQTEPAADQPDDAAQADAQDDEREEGAVDAAEDASAETSDTSFAERPISPRARPQDAQEQTDE